MASERVLHSLAAIVLVVGLWLSHQVDPRVRVDRLFLNGRIATIKFTPRLAGPHPNVLMAHGVGASKETLFRLGEALAASGLTCYAIDLPGHGGSSFRFRAHDNAETLREAAQEIGSIDVFVGHSMGAYAGADAIYRHYMAPRLLIALGALPSTKAPLLVLVGRWDEAVPAGHLPPQHLIVS
ncbi:MAG TPA: alpha/beta fold hydrolase, partial [Candidatus Xenobia bacterium]